MSHLIESIRIHHGVPYLLRYHQLRMNRSIRDLFGTKSYPSLNKSMVIPSELNSGLVKCRVTYGREIEHISFENYERPKLKSIKIIEDNEIAYKHKYSNRERLNHWKGTCETGQDFIIVKNGLLTDGFYYNIVLERQAQMFTPSKPLLKGVMRQYLLEKKLIKRMDISVNELYEFEKLHLINAMNPLNHLTFTINSGLFTT
jgi:4-amino-4-deoxychorismate lyase